MKKLIAISVVFALVAGAAFAADVGAVVYGSVELAKGSGKKDAKGDSPNPGTGYSEGRVRLEASGENDDGTFGGYVRFQTGSQGGGVNAWGNGWWKPIEQVRFLIGSNGGDNFFGLEGVTGWGFYGVACDVKIIDNGNVWGGTYTGLGYWINANSSWNSIRLRDAFYGGWDNGALLTITPMEALEINIGIPYGDEARNSYPKTTAQIAYTAEGLGKFGVTYQGGIGHRDADPTKAVNNTATWADLAAGNPIFKDDGSPATAADVASAGGDITKFHTVGTEGEVNDPAKFFIFAGVTAIENLEIDVGFGYTMAYTKEDKTKVQAPMAIGLGVGYNAGEFGVKVRTVATLAGSVTPDGGDAIKIPLMVLFDVLPSYAVNDNLSALCSIGVGYQAKSSNDGDKDSDYSKLAFHVQPYVEIKGGSTWHPNFFAGIRLETTGRKFKDGAESKDGSTYMDWSVPIGIAFAF